MNLFYNVFKTLYWNTYQNSFSLLNRSYVISNFNTEFFLNLLQLLLTSTRNNHRSSLLKEESSKPETHSARGTNYCNLHFSASHIFFKPGSISSSGIVKAILKYSRY